MQSKENRGAKVRHAVGNLGRTLLVFAFMVIVSFACMYKIHSLKEESDTLDAEIEELEAEIEEEKQNQIEEQVLSKYYESDAYKEQLARNRLNLIYEGDRLYVLE